MKKAHHSKQSNVVELNYASCRISWRHAGCQMLMFKSVMRKLCQNRETSWISVYPKTLKTTIFDGNFKVLEEYLETQHFNITFSTCVVEKINR